jgi:hypothetical protein
MKSTKMFSILIYILISICKKTNKNHENPLMTVTLQTHRTQTGIYNIILKFTTEREAMYVHKFIDVTRVYYFNTVNIYGIPSTIFYTNGFNRHM